MEGHGLACDQKLPFDWLRHAANVRCLADDAFERLPALRAAFLDANELAEHLRLHHSMVLDECLGLNCVLDEAAASAHRNLSWLAAPDENAPTGVRRIGGRLIIWLWGPIQRDLRNGFQNSATVVDALCKHSDAIAVVFRIASFGGDVNSTLDVLAAMDRHPGRFVAVIDKMAMSSAAVIASSCHKVLIREDATMLHHRVWGIARGDSCDLRRKINEFSIHDHAFNRRIAASRRLRHDVVERLMRHGMPLTAAEAVKFGLADRVIPSLKGYCK